MNAQPSLGHIILIFNNASILKVENTTITTNLINWLIIILQINNYLKLFYLNSS
jgi:hypothetical protein